MLKFASILVICGIFVMPDFSAVETFATVPVLPVYCAEKSAADPDSHKRTCGIMCKKSGYGIVTENHKFLKFDEDGNKKAFEALKATDKQDHLRVDVAESWTAIRLKLTRSSYYSSASKGRDDPEEI